MMAKTSTPTSSTTSKNSVEKNPPKISFEELLKKDYNTLCTCIDPDGTKSVNLVLALDEVEPLTNWQDRHGPRYLPSHILGQVIKVYSESEERESGVWVIFTSTNSKITHFAAPASIHASARVMNEGQLLFQPFSALQWDVLAVPVEKLDVRSVGSYNDVIRFGRPLWSNVSKIHTTPEKMTAFALLKLACGRVDHRNLTPDVSLAVLSQRFALRIAFDTKEAVSLIENSVSSHMRYLLSTSQDQTWQYTLYPVEPVLSSGAAEFMYMDQQHLSIALWHLIRKATSTGVIDAGELGELISRLLILISRDLATIVIEEIPVACKIPDNLRSACQSLRFPSLSDKEYFPYLKPVRLLDVLAVLLGPKWSSEHDEKIKNIFERAYISASQWITMTDNVGPLPHDIEPEEWLRLFFLRGVAIQCRHDQPLIDKVIPVLFLDASNHYAGMSCCLIQDKNKGRKDGQALRSIDICDQSINLDTGKPYIAICFNHGVKDEKPAKVTVPEKPVQNTSAIRIEVQGLSEKVFPVLQFCEIGPKIIELRNAHQTSESSHAAGEHFIRSTVLYGTSKTHLKWGEPPTKGRKRKNDALGEATGEVEDDSIEVAKRPNTTAESSAQGARKGSSSAAGGSNAEPGSSVPNGRKKKPRTVKK
ncbi:hypothetical protein K435DRAFT_133037 [Dendrothele bispora CBS 962.96]|uniref:Uncharacterized protein n=1 Tax=Dendrothele bispora (strain CBS 962.96) TaxID=1314807 RepID=A0A4S8KND4_DENBC|nr:hypothetical protein K435DRAFT_133037 [Dendrothele bispora CBS 962.96]